MSGKTLHVLPKRKANRLKQCDYSQAGAYFVSICVKDRRNLLATIEAPVGANCVRPQLTHVGQVVDDEIAVLSNAYQCVTVERHVIVPNHVHMVIVVDGDNGGGRTQFAPTISRIIKQWKGSLTKKLRENIWQKSFHDHVIRNEGDCRRVLEYIENNPAQWRLDCYYSAKGE
jgi:REP element-mobilizing transposase RayT